MANTAKIAPFDNKTFTLELAEPFGPVLEALGKPSTNVPFMMPARIASTPADQQIKEVVGSGPFKFAKDGLCHEVTPVHTALRNCTRDEAAKGASGEVVAPSALFNKPTERPMSQPFDASKSLATLEQDNTVIAVIEMSQSKWLVAAVVPGVKRQPLKKLQADEEALLKLLYRWRTEAGQTGR